jgi:hypothetical protein
MRKRRIKETFQMKTPDLMPRRFGIAPAVLLVAGLTVLPTTFVSTARAQSLDGYWQSPAYGLLVEIRGSRMNTSQITSISCLSWWTAERSEADGAKGDVVFNRGDALIRLTRGPSPDTLLMRVGVSVSSVTLHRLDGRPKICDQKLADTPQNNYAVFWQTFAEQFALFQVYRTDWVTIDRKYRTRVTASTTPEELFNILREMILPFHNAHTSINARSIKRIYVGYRPVSEIGRKLQEAYSFSPEDCLDLFKRQAKQTNRIIKSKYSRRGLQSYCNDVIYFGMLKDSVGYLRILGFDGFTAEGGFEKESKALEAALDDVFRAAERMKGLVIDVRLNVGGADPFGLAIASRLTEAKYLAYSKVTRNNLSGVPRFTAPQPAWVNVSARPRYRGKVVLLIGPDTISGGESFAMALMGREPRVILIGDNTQGVFSDVVGRKLPNGWTFGVPNELYKTKTGRSYDGQGVPPDIRVPVFPKEDLEGSRDGALEKALEVFDRSEPSGK